MGKIVEDSSLDSRFDLREYSCDSSADSRFDLRDLREDSRDSCVDSRVDSCEDSPKNAPPKLAIIVPCYNEEAAIEASFHALNDKLSRLIASQKVSAESFLCFVDDGSKDSSFEKLCALKAALNRDLGLNLDSAKNCDSANRDSAFNLDSASNHASTLNPNAKKSYDSPPPRIHILRLSKNYGQQSALLAGLEFCAQKCDCAISIDCDLQQDINAMDAMLAAFQAGAHIVYGVRKAYTHEGAFKKYTSLAFYKIMNLMGVKILKNHIDYRLLSRHALNALLEFGEVNLFMRGIVQTLGFKSAIVKYEQFARNAGETKYSALKLFALAWEAITSFSVAPLRFLSVFGCVLCTFSAIYGIYAIFMRIFNAQTISGWASIIVVLLFFGGMQFLALGLLGEYVGKIYKEVKKRPRYIIDEIR